MVEDNPVPNALKTLADDLADERDQVLANWHDKVAAQGDTTIINTLSRDDFYDHIPGFLDHLCAQLRGNTANVPLPARQHGAHRWQQGLDLNEVVHEWSSLHGVLIDHVVALCPRVGLDLATLQEAWRLLAQTIDQSIAASLEEYHGRQHLEAEARTRDIEAALEERTEREGERGRVLRRASHDLRGSLQTITLSCSVLKRRNLDDESQTIVERLTGAATSVQHLLSELLDLSRLEAGREQRHISNFNAGKLLQDLCNEMQPLAEEVSLSLCAEGSEVLPVQGDSIKIRRIAQNLVLNALKYTSTGSITIAWEGDSTRRWLLSVHDTGPGLPGAGALPLAAGLEDAANGAQQPVQTVQHATGQEPDADGDRPGIQAQSEGIGLAIVYQLCDLLDGVVEVESKVGHGTTFRVLLPSVY